MKVLKWTLFGVCYSFLLICAFTNPTETARVLLRRNSAQAITTTERNVANIVASPINACGEGYQLDHRNKCRKTADGWFD